MNPNSPNPIRLYDLLTAIVGMISLGLICFRFTLEETKEVARLVDWFDTGICALFFFDFLRNCVQATE